MIAASPWKNWNTPTVARMTPAKTDRPPAHAVPVDADCWFVGDEWFDAAGV